MFIQGKERAVLVFYVLLTFNENGNPFSEEAVSTLQEIYLYSALSTRNLIEGYGWVAPFA